MQVYLAWYNPNVPGSNLRLIGVYKTQELAVKRANEGVKACRKYCPAGSGIVTIMPILTR